jgi:hypothetical protein
MLMDKEPWMPSPTKTTLHLLLKLYFSKRPCPLPRNTDKKKTRCMSPCPGLLR